MITVLYLAHKQVKQQLFDAVQAAEVPVLVTLVRAGPGMRPIDEREPFERLETEFGDKLLQLVIADEGKPEGMWRDPVGDLAEKLYPEDRTSAYMATNGYVLVHQGKPVAVVKKLAALEDDVGEIQAALKKAGLGGRAAGPRPAAGPAPGAPRPKPSVPPASAPAASTGRATTASAHVPTPSPFADVDPYLLLGVPRGTSRAEARKAFRALMIQYHPDKVAHLAPDFRDLAERKSRAITEAWEQIQREVSE